MQKNKEYKKIFSTLNSVIDFWKIPIIKDESLVFNNNSSKKLLNKKNISYGHTLENILKLALSNKTDSIYIVFGSFIIVSATLSFFKLWKKIKKINLMKLFF